MKNINKLAKNLLLGRTCQDCNQSKYIDYNDIIYSKEIVCGSYLRAKRNKRIKGIDSTSWKEWKKNGMEIPNEGVCEFWE